MGLFTIHWLHLFVFMSIHSAFSKTHDPKWYFGGKVTDMEKDTINTSSNNNNFKPYDQIASEDAEQLYDAYNQLHTLAQVLMHDILVIFLLNIGFERTFKNLSIAQRS